MAPHFLPATAVSLSGFVVDPAVTREERRFRHMKVLSKNRSKIAERTAVDAVNDKLSGVLCIAMYVQMFGLCAFFSSCLPFVFYLSKEFEALQVKNKI